ncbi:hypothetical protein PR202_ga16428 [Eleusine coracana subsp. coracana]|uniref:Uncharacterized protein n=1 Tax=Eleusine coracana subsp. coracana TaxID=191504 RepID=A0AAV5CLH5_ELECO|nr:hypothetical protein QOZ80_6AG0528550 [Eleusine coracana subsp. coracana]GJM99338.1 hypothetical protein PR202_ga16428 [Eleusine coracana subsp. coracana]
MMSPSVLAAAAALIVFILYVVKHRQSCGGGKLPPSPPSLPLVGHVHLMSPLAHRSLLDLQLRYGSSGGLLLLQLGRYRTLVASTAAAATDIFKHHDVAFASRTGGAVADKLMYGRRNVSFAPYGEHWRRAKKVAVVHLLSPRRVEALARVRGAEAAALVDAVRRAAGGGEVAVELRPLLVGYTNAVVTRATTGAAGHTAEKLKRLLGGSEALAAGFQADDVLPGAAARAVRRATGLEKKLDEQVAAWDQFFAEIMAAHAEKGADGAGKEEAEDIMAVLLRLREEGGTEGLELTDDVIKAIVKDMITAATDTSSVTIEWTMAELAANPRVMAKLNDEIARVFANADHPATIAEADLGRMEYLRAVLKEVLRLHPPAPLLVPHHSTTPTVVQGYEVPANTALFINAWAIGRDPAAWDEPEEFRPERFVEGSSAGVDFRGSDYQLVPFGAGRRVCPGINFALPVVELALVSLLHHFEWSLPDGMRPDDLDMVEAPGLTTPRRVPLVLVPRARLY